MKNIRLYITGLVLCLMLGWQSEACLTFCIQKGASPFYGRNFDWDVDVGAVFLNVRSVEKTAFVVPPDKPMTWLSNYASITFNQFSKEVPVGGMNERGLVIESLVSHVSHTPRDQRKAINELQWIQYHLDTCKDVDEVLASARKVRISRYAVSLHYFVADASGKSAVIEFLEQKVIERSGADLPKNVLANNRYDFSLRSLASQKGRFYQAAKMVDKYDGKEDAVEYAFKVLDEVAQGDFTKWQVVYDIENRKIHFRSLKKKKIKIIGFSDFDLDHAKEAMLLDINSDGEGSVRKRFVEYSEERNNELISESMKEFRKHGIMNRIKSSHIDRIREIVASCKYVESKEDDNMTGPQE